ncbi:hypothetical protein JCM11641_002023 [Rhodosporidiobolus odoratus]
MSAPTTDEEQQPLLGDSSQPADNTPPSLSSRARTFLSNPKQLNGLEKALAFLSILLLLLVAVFSGLFAGEVVKYSHLKHRKQHDGGKGGGGNDGPTATVTGTSTVPGPTTTVTPIPKHPGSGDLCLTGACVQSAAKVLASLDTTVDPCDDFYTFANGGWLASHEIPAGEGGFGTFQQVDQKNKRIIRAVIDAAPDPSLPEADQRNLAHLRSFWNSCTDESKIAKQGQKPLLDVVEEAMSAWRGDAHVLDEEEVDFLLQAEIELDFGGGKKGHGKKEKMSKKRWDPKTKTQRLTDALMFLHSRGIPALFSTYTEGDVGASPSTNVLWLTQAGLSLPSKDYYQDNSTIAFYQRIVEKILEEVYEERGEGVADVEDLADGVVRLEKKIAKASLGAADLDLPIPTYNPHNSTALQSLFPSITFKDYFASYTPRPKYPEPVIVTSPAFFSNLSEILDKTGPGVLEAYFVVHTVLTYGDLLSPKLPLAKQVNLLSNRLAGIPADDSKPRPQLCLDAALENYGFLLGRPFVQQAFGGESKDYAEDLIHAVIAAFKERLPGRDWLDEKTRRKAEEKVGKIKVKIGYPTSPNTTDPSSLERYYTPKLPINDHDFFGNVLRSRVAEERRKWVKVGRQVERGEWDMVPSEVNAYYQPSANEIVFPAGILQPPFFNVDWPEYLNLGAFGSVAGHELSHGCDQSGRLYDGDGYLRDWWSKEASEGFEKGQNCFRHQYQKYTIIGPDGRSHAINSNLTGGEDGADNGGLAQSYTAWQTRLKSDPKGKKYNNFELPGLQGEYTREQVFFLAYAQGWARKMTGEEAVRRIRTDPHSPTQYRVIGPLSNSKEFAEAWGCKAGTRMNRGEARCEMW